MNAIFRKLIARKTWRRLKEERPDEVISNYEFAREFRKVRLDFVTFLRMLRCLHWVYILLGLDSRVS